MKSATCIAETGDVQYAKIRVTAVGTQHADVASDLGDNHSHDLFKSTFLD